jgi:hypothetical protein
MSWSSSGIKAGYSQKEKPASEPAANETPGQTRPGDYVMKRVKSKPNLYARVREPPKLSGENTPRKIADTPPVHAYARRWKHR